MTTDVILAISQVVVIAFVVGVLSWDLFAQLRGGSKATVSWAVWGFAQKAPWVVFIVGFVCGHLFWGDPNIMIQPPVGQAAAIGGNMFAIIGLILLAVAGVLFLVIRRAVKKASGQPVFHLLKRGHASHWY